MDISTTSLTANDGGDSSNDGQASHKRRSEADIANDLPSKRRASKACLSCRSRKVRCDVVNGGVPCTNCRLDNVECVVIDSHRGRKPTIRPSTASHNFPVVLRSSPSEPAQADPTTPESSHQADEYLVTLSFEDQDASTGHSHTYPHPAPSLSRHNQQRVESMSRSLSPGLSLAQDRAPQISHNAPRLPTYIRQPPPHITSRDMEYLAAKDALTIPDSPLRDELLRTYVAIVHPFMPLLDLDQFLGPIMVKKGNPVSLLVFQAVMFASITFVDMKYLQASGYGCRKTARKAFFDRARLLYGLECERDQPSLLQALLLMTFWYNSPEDEKDTWYWMGIAFSLAQVLGLHHDPDKLPISSEEKRLRRRLWWSCVMRDRLLALGLRRPSRIRKEEFDVPMLTPDDFQVGIPSDALATLFGESTLAISGSKAGTALVGMCIDLAKLCVCVGHILHSQYTVLGSRKFSSDYFTKVIVVPRRSEQQVQELSKCDAELTSWFENRNDDSKYESGSAQGGDEAARTVHLHQALLQMLYLTSLGALHRPQVFRSDSNARDKKRSKDKVTEAAISLTKLAFDLESHDQLRYLSTSSIPAFLSVSLFHLLDARSSDEEVRNLSIGRFYQCQHVLHQLQDMYASADYALRFVDMVLKNTKIKIPILGIDRRSENRLESSSQSAASCSSPSASKNLAPVAGGVNGSLYPQTSLPADSLEISDFFQTWTSGGNEISSSANNQLSTSSNSFSGPYLESWADMQGLIPELMNFNSDFHFHLGNHST